MANIDTSGRCPFINQWVMKSRMIGMKPEPMFEIGECGKVLCELYDPFTRKCVFNLINKNLAEMSARLDMVLKEKNDGK